jgi:predicted outer membrane repeat protein
MQSRRNPTRPLLLAAALGLPLPSLAAVVHVKATASGSANGSSWANATSLQAALAAAQPGDQLWVAKGVHKPAPAGNPTVSFVIPDGVAVYGGFAGTESTLAQRDWQANPTVLSGDIDGNDTVDADGVTTARAGLNSHHVVRTGVVSSTSRLDGFTISGGNGGATSLQNWQQASNGGGWLNEGGTPGLRRLRFVQNVARNGGGLYTTAALSLEDIEFRSNGVWQDGGGAFFTGTGNHTLKKVRFNDNLAYTGSGGGMRCAQSNLTLLDSDFRGNTAPKQSGGGFSGQTCPAIMLRASFVENSAGGHSIFDHGGGGIHQLDGTLLLSEVRLQENHASGGDGGGLMARAPDVLVEKSLLLGNKASGSGGGASVAAYNAILRSSAVRGNVSGGDACYAQQTGNGWEPCYFGQGGGGGISLEGGNTTLVNMLVSGNVAPNGGGIRNRAGTQRETRIINSTFTGNYAAPSWDPAADPEWTGKGGGIWNGDGRTFIHNSIFWNNQDRTGVGTHRASVDNADIRRSIPTSAAYPTRAMDSRRSLSPTHWCRAANSTGSGHRPGNPVGPAERTVVGI